LETTPKSPLFFLYYENILLFIVFEYTYLPLCCVRPTSFSSGERVVVVVVVASVFFLFVVVVATKKPL